MNAAPATAFAAVLAFSAVLSALVVRKTRVKAYVDTAAAAMAILAVSIACAPQVGTRVVDAVALVALSLAPAAMALAAYAHVLHVPPQRVAGATLSFALACGGLAAVSGFAAPSLVPLGASVVASLVIAVPLLRRRTREALLIVVSALAWIATAAAYLRAGPAAASLFGAVGLLGTALATASHFRVEQKGWLSRSLSVRSKR